MSQVTELITFLRSQIAKPYTLGATGPNDYDCSGLVYAAYKDTCQIDLPRLSNEQYQAGSNVEHSALQPGDIVFFDTGWSERNPDHCGIYTGNGNFINANSYYNAVKEESLESNYWKPLFYGARRILNNAGSGSSSSTVASTNSTVSTAGSNKSILQKGMQGSAVQALHQKLASHGYLPASESNNTTFDDQTVQALQEFQIGYLLIKKLTDPIAGIYEGQTKSKLEHLTSPLTDVLISSASAPYITFLFNRGIVQGYADNVFKPNQAINRAEALKIILETFGITSGATTPLPFKDVKKTDWFYTYLQNAYRLGIIKGFESPSGTMFKPADAITRAEAVKIILALCKIPLVYPSSPHFTDISKGDWYYQFVETAGTLQMLIPNKSGKIEANRSITRAELCQAVVRAYLSKYFGL